MLESGAPSALPIATAKLYRVPGTQLVVERKLHRAVLPPEWTSSRTTLLLSIGTSNQPPPVPRRPSRRPAPSSARAQVRRPQRAKSTRRPMRATRAGRGLERERSARVRRAGAPLRYPQNALVLWSADLPGARNSDRIRRVACARGPDPTAPCLKCASKGIS